MATATILAPPSRLREVCGGCMGRGPSQIPRTPQHLKIVKNPLVQKHLLFRTRMGARGARQRRSAACSAQASSGSLPFFAHAGKAAQNAHTHAAGKAASDSVASAAAAAATTQTNGNVPLLDDGLLDHTCRWAVRKLCKGDHDVLSFLPDSIHKYLHVHEATAALVLREGTLLFIVFLLISNRSKICRWFHSIWSRGLSNYEKTLDEEYMGSVFSALSQPLGFSLGFLTASRMVRLFGPFAKISVPVSYLRSFQGVVLIVSWVWFFLDWKKKALARVLVSAQGDKARLVALDKLLSLFIYTVGIASAAEITGLALKSVIAIGGVSSFAVGFASKAVLSNFAGGLMLYITRPFSIGEFIKAGPHSGQVLDIGFYSTKLLGSDMVPVYIPNDSFTNIAVTNFSRAKLKVVNSTFMLRTQYVIESIDKITNQIEVMLKSHPAVDLKGGSCYCALKNLGPEYSEVSISCTVKKMGSERFYKMQQEIFVKAANIIIEAGGLYALVRPLPGPI